MHVCCSKALSSETPICDVFTSVLFMLAKTRLDKTGDKRCKAGLYVYYYNVNERRKMVFDYGFVDLCDMIQVYWLGLRFVVQYH